MVDNRIAPASHLKDVDDPWKEFHDVPATQESIQKLLSGGTPDWVKWPEDYKSFAQEEFERHRQVSETLAQQYKMEDQDELTNRKARMVRPMSTLSFVQKLRDNGIRCFVVNNDFPPQTVALWCLPPKEYAKARYICYMQVPAMYEWSVLKTDRYGKPMGEAYRGWRTVLIQLVEKQILTEYQIHQIFGHPSDSRVFQRYQCSLWEIRNGRKKTLGELKAADV